MHRRHLKAVTAIEHEVFPSAWSLALFLSELAMPESRAYYVAKSDGEVIGYAGLMVSVGEGHVMTIGVTASAQRRGIGRLLLYELTCEALRRGAEELSLEVRVSNLGAQALYREFGFVPVGVRKNYYAEVHEDALVMFAYGIASAQYRDRLTEIAGRIPYLGAGPGREQPGESSKLT